MRSTMLDSSKARFALRCSSEGDNNGPFVVQTREPQSVEFEGGVAGIELRLEMSMRGKDVFGTDPKIPRNLPDSYAWLARWKSSG